ncbi:MAG: HNH endonuclease [bacterium]|jgi:hypothetical protein
MKLPDFRKVEQFNALRHVMGAELIEWHAEPGNWEHFSSEEWEALLTTGWDVSLEEITTSEQGLFEYKGKKVIVYIRDQYSLGWMPISQYKYHICDCITLQRMRSEGRYKARYVVTIRKDGKFLVNRMNRFSPNEGRNKEVVMKLCLNCWKVLSHLPELGMRNVSYDNFDISTYFSTFDTLIRDLPTYSEHTMPENEYSPHHDELSRIFRKNRHWKCEACGIDLRTAKHFLHLHHINGNKSDNSLSNLKALCIGCHSRQPRHGHLLNHPDMTKFESFRTTNLHR